MKTFFKLIFIFFLILISYQMNAQEWFNEPFLKSKPDSNSKYNFYDIQKAFQLYEMEFEKKHHYISAVESEGEDEGKFRGYNEYKRWEWFNEKRVYPSGKFPEVENILKDYNQLLQSRLTSASKNGGNAIASASWVNLVSAFAPIGNTAGIGRVNCMTFMPGDYNTIFVGTACGGVWKSNDGGTTWAVLNTDQLPSLSITSICIDPLNPNNIYIATGDNFTGFPIAGVLKQGHFSAGIYKSVDGGLTWVLAGMPSTQDQGFIPQQMILDPATPSTLLLASNTGIWRSVNSGTTWTLVHAGFHYSIEFNPLNHNVVYATDKLGLYRSNNNGVNWSYKGGGYPNAANSGRVTLAVTPADTNYIYLWGPSAGFKRSTNGGTSFITMTNPDAIAQPYGYVDQAVGVSKTNALNVMVGGLTTAKSIDGGATWIQASDWQNYLLPNWVHCDVKKIIWEPGSGSKLYMLNDAGIAVSANNSLTWTNISHGLQIAEIYKIANNPFSADTVYYGAQDNGTNRWNATTATNSLLVPGDGFQPLVDPTNSQVIFTSAQLGGVKKSIDGGVNFVSASPGQMLWDCPLKMNPLNPQIMYAGCTAGVKKSTVGGTQGSYVNLTATVLDWIIALDVTKANDQYVYAASLDSMIRSTDAGASWSYITAGLPTALAAITYITVSPNDANKVYVTFSGYSAANKVFMSTDGGNNWINYTGTQLPNVPVNCITYVDGSNDAVYIGTDFGVYYRDANLSDWIPYNTDLPNVIVNHLDIHYGTMKLRAGTYGRGLWETDLITTGTLPVELLSFKGKYNRTTNANDLQWTTASENSNSFFEVMKSSDAKYFSSIGKVVGVGNSIQTSRYNFSDKSFINGTNYYYIKQTDINGKQTISNTISICTNNENNFVVVFPNPASDEIQFQFLNRNEIYDLELYDVVGKQIVLRPAITLNTNADNSVDVSFLKSGIYLLKITKATDGEFFFGRFVKN